MKKHFWLLISVVAILAFAFSACKPKAESLSVMYTWSGTEEEKINTILSPFVEANNVEVVAESTRDEAVVDTKVKSTPPRHSLLV